MPGGTCSRVYREPAQHSAAYAGAGAANLMQISPMKYIPPPTQIRGCPGSPFTK
jgi:hypothetical protein